MIILGPDTAAARRQLNALRAMLRAVGSAQARFLPVDRQSAVMAEATALSIEQHEGNATLAVDLERAMSGRGGRISWVLRRLLQLARYENVEVHVTTPPIIRTLISDSVVGGTTPARHSMSIAGRRYAVLPGPYDLIRVRAATQHPRTGASRADLDIGRTLVHELVIHAWRDAFFYQPYNASHPRPPFRIAIRTHAGHLGRPHVTRGPSEAHNLPDAEADLIDYYYDLAHGRDISYGTGMHASFGRAVRALGTMAAPLTRWELSPQAQQMRAAAAEMAAERRRFMHAASQFQRQVERMRRLEFRVERETTAMDQRISFYRQAQVADERGDQTLLPVQGRRTVHHVQRGENLSIISRKYYGNPRDWRKIYNYPENRQKIGRNPNVIYPGQTLIIPD